MTPIVGDVAREIAERHLVDRCRITHDVEGRSDDTYDPDTLEIVHPDHDAATIFVGPCLISPVAVGITDRREADQQGYREGYQIRLPASCPPPAIGDQVTITGSPGNPSLVDQTFAVAEIPERSIRGSRIIKVTQRRVGPRL